MKADEIIAYLLDMTTIPRILTLMLAVYACLQTPLEAQGKSTSKSKHLARITKNRDGSTTEFKRDPGNTTLVKRTYVETANGEQVTRTRTIYRRDKFGNLRSGAIYDGKNTKLFRVVYGYHADSGRLIAENMYDARVRRTNPKDPSKEEPVRATRYHYTAQGERSAPITFTSQAGRTSEELMGWLNRNKDKGSDHDRDPFKRVPVNPNAKPLGK
ncbi:MAG: hypothetical protein ABGY95_00270 [Rubritalea sp.]|uniref:hypothetical protein n=1 Tax=Rubritalea sp. TaxID=2109375 RepID=UPI003242F5F0